MAVSQVRVKVNGTWTVLTYNSSTAKYEGTLAAPSITSYNVNASHYYPVTVEATDLASNVTTKDDTDATLGASLKLTVKETTIPTIAFTAPTSGAYIPTGVPAITFQLRDEVNGSGIKISSLVLKVDGGVTITNVSVGVTVTTVTNGYDISYTPQASLSDGAHTVTINVQDNDGNAATQASRTFTTDTTSPTLTITSPSSDIYTNNASLTIVGVTNDATSNPVTVTVNGVSATVDGSGNFSKTVTLVAGSNTIAIIARDGATRETTIVRTVVLDQIAPVIGSITITPNPVNVGNSYVISVSVTDA